MEMCRNGLLNLPKNLSGNARNLVKQILVEDPIQRFEIKEIKEHNFFRGINWELIM